MTSDQTTPGPDEQTETGQEIGLMLRTDEGTTYVIPVSVVESYRLTDEQRETLEARPTTVADDDTAGHQFIGTFPSGVPRLPGSYGWFWLYADIVTNKNRDDPNGYRPLVR
jgi:hypothetical protein